MSHEYTELRNGGYYLTGTRISLDSVAYLYRDGASAEQIQDDFPALSLEQIHGAIAFYLANKKAVDQNMEAGEREISMAVPPLAAANPDLYARLQRMRQESNRN